MAGLDKLLTEQSNPASASIDTLNTESVLRKSFLISINLHLLKYIMSLKSAQIMPVDNVLVAFWCV